MSPDIEKFCVNFIVSGDEVQAYKETFQKKSGYVARTAKRDAAAFKKTHQRYISERLALLSREALRAKRLDAKAVLERIAQIAFADVTEVAKVRRVNCRYCWGPRFRYQMTPAEYDGQCADAFIEAQIKKTDYVAPEKPPGGLNFVISRPPHPDCPECAGEGVAELFVQDFSKVSEDVKPLIAGVEHTRYGIKVSFHSQTSALETLAKSFGLLQPDIVNVIVQQMAPKEEKFVFDASNQEQAAETYKRLINGSN